MKRAFSFAVAVLITMTLLLPSGTPALANDPPPERQIDKDKIREQDSQTTLQIISEGVNREELKQRLLKRGAPAEESEWEFGILTTKYLSGYDSDDFSDAYVEEEFASTGDLTGIYPFWQLGVVGTIGTWWRGYDPLFADEISMGSVYNVSSGGWWYIPPNEPEWSIYGSNDENAYWSDTVEDDWRIYYSGVDLGADGFSGSFQLYQSQAATHTFDGYQGSPKHLSASDSEMFWY